MPGLCFLRCPLSIKRGGNWSFPVPLCYVLLFYTPLKLGVTYYPAIDKGLKPESLHKLDGQGLRPFSNEILSKGTNSDAGQRQGDARKGSEKGKRCMPAAGL